MQCTLMNKNTPIIDLQIDYDSSAITKVLKVYDLNYLPVGIEKRAGLQSQRFKRMVAGAFHTSQPSGYPGSTGAFGNV